MFQYFELIVNTLFSPQVLLLILILYMLKYKQEVVERIKSMKIFGAEIDLAHIEKSIDSAVSKIDHLEEKLDGLKSGYITKSKESFDPIAPAKDLDKLGRELKAMAAALDDIDFVANYLKKGANPDEVYAAGCAIQVRPQPKFLIPLTEYISEITKDEKLGDIRMRIAFKLLQCLEKIISVDSRRDEMVISQNDIEKTIAAIQELARHPICDADRPTDGSDGIPSKVEKLVAKFKRDAEKRKT